MESHARDTPPPPRGRDTPQNRAIPGHFPKKKLTRLALKPTPGFQYPPPQGGGPAHCGRPPGHTTEVEVEAQQHLRQDQPPENGPTPGGSGGQPWSNPGAGDSKRPFARALGALGIHERGWLSAPLAQNGTEGE